MLGISPSGHQSSISRFIKSSHDDNFLIEVCLQKALSIALQVVAVLAVIHFVRPSIWPAILSRVGYGGSACPEVDAALVPVTDKHDSSRFEQVTLFAAWATEAEQHELNRGLAELSQFKKIVYQKYSPDLPNYVANPKARETLAWLQFIVDHYDTLSDWTVFLHPHPYGSWHQSYSTVDFLLALRWDHLRPLTMFPGNLCNVVQRVSSCMGGSVRSPRQVIDAWHSQLGANDKRCLTSLVFYHTWDTVLQPFLGKAPAQISNQACCLQSIVHRSRIQARPKVFWQRLLHWLGTQDYPDFLSSRIIEWGWGSLLGEPAWNPAMCANICELATCNLLGQPDRSLACPVRPAGLPYSE